MKALLSKFFFFFKQKTAYEISSRDWSSDVCSSDLVRVPRLDVAVLLHQRRIGVDPRRRHGSSTTNGCPPNRVLRRRCTWAASSCVAYRPTRTLNRPLVSRTTRASKPMTLRRVSISSTCDALLTARTCTAKIVAVAGGGGFAWVSPTVAGVPAAATTGIAAQRRA